MQIVRPGGARAVGSRSGSAECFRRRLEDSLFRNAPVDFEFADPATSARALLGSHLIRVLNGKARRVRIVETEAYGEEDPASHSFVGMTSRNRVMFGPPGTAYIYRIHRVVCLNVVVGPEGRGEAVLIRAVEPVSGVKEMEAARARQTVGHRIPRGVTLTNGPGKLCQALDVTLDWNGADLLGGPQDGADAGMAGSDVDTNPDPDPNPGRRCGSLFLELRSADEPFAIGCSPRIGISKAVQEPLRFFIKDNQWVSRRQRYRSRGSGTDSAATR